MKEYTEKELKNKAEVYCLAAERCPLEVLTKLLRWGATEEQAQALVEGLEKDRFIDVRRFCRAFVRDKYRFSGWGKIKIMQALKLKRLPPDAISEGLAEIDGEEYDEVLYELLRRKYRTISARNEYERTGKLIRFAMGRGYTMDEVMKCVRMIASDEYME